MVGHDHLPGGLTLCRRIFQPRPLSFHHFAVMKGLVAVEEEEIDGTNTHRVPAVSFQEAEVSVEKCDTSALTIVVVPRRREKSSGFEKLAIQISHQGLKSSLEVDVVAKCDYELCSLSHNEVPNIKCGNLSRTVVTDSPNCQFPGGPYEIRVKMFATWADCHFPVVRKHQPYDTINAQ